MSVERDNKEPSPRRGGGFLLWIGESLTRKFLLGTAFGLLTTSLVFLLLFLGMYRAQLQFERSEASRQVNALLQASLENAMLKRDLEGLRDIVERLGRQDGITSVMIINPANEVRFTSEPSLLGHRYSPETDSTCIQCHAGGERSGQYTMFMENEQGKEVLRSVNPVQNKTPCTKCHGPLEVNPVNGVLFVDYDAATIRENAQNTTLILMGAGALVVFVTLTGGWWFMRRFVLSPVNQLSGASARIAHGQLATRVTLEGNDELARLGNSFNDMASHLQSSLRQIRENESYLQGLIDAIPDGVRVIDQQYRVITCNGAYSRQIGLTPEQIKSRHCYELGYGLSAPCPPTMITCPLHEIVDNGQPIKCLHKFQLESGRALDVEIIAAPLRVVREGREQVLIVESIRDLSKQIKFSQEQKLSALGLLAAGVAHEIGNPLGSIRLALQSLERASAAGEVDPEETLSYLRLVDSEIDKCIDVSQRLLKLSSGQMHAKDLVCLNTALTETISLLSWEGKAKGVVIEQRLTDSDMRLLAIESDIRMIVLNLILNAFYAMPDGGTLTVSSRREKNALVMSFADSGVGISHQDMPHIFDPFFTKRASKERGTGLGLSITKNLVEKFGGRITVSSEPGKGAVFDVILPMTELDDSVGGE
ncbi:MAG: ATP-binding protein [Candidatus Sedimenticola endophacoides]